MCIYTPNIVCSCGVVFVCKQPHMTIMMGIFENCKTTSKLKSYPAHKTKQYTIYIYIYIYVYTYTYVYICIHVYAAAVAAAAAATAAADAVAAAASCAVGLLACDPPFGRNQNPTEEH